MRSLSLRTDVQPSQLHFRGKSLAHVLRPVWPANPVTARDGTKQSAFYCGSSSALGRTRSPGRAKAKVCPVRSSFVRRSGLAPGRVGFVDLRLGLRGVSGRSSKRVDVVAAVPPPLKLRAFLRTLCAWSLDVFMRTKAVSRRLEGSSGQKGGRARQLRARLAGV